jgi:hypothetical protein
MLKSVGRKFIYPSFVHSLSKRPYRLGSGTFISREIRKLLQIGKRRQEADKGWIDLDKLRGISEQN